MRLHWSKAGTSLSWPNSWDGSTHFPNNGPLRGNQVGLVSIPVIAPGQSVIVKMPFFPPNGTDYEFAGSDNWHFCLLARIEAASDPMTYPEIFHLVTNLTHNNNIAMKNLTVVDAIPNSGGKNGGVIAVGNPFDVTTEFNLNFVTGSSETGKPIYEEAEVTIVLDDTLLQAWDRAGKKSVDLLRTKDPNTFLVLGNNANLTLTFGKNEIGTLALRFNFLTKEVTEKMKFVYNVGQRISATNELVGGETYEIQKGERQLFFADSGGDKKVDRNEMVTINAEVLNEPAKYNWYDSNGNLIYEGPDFQTAAEVAKTYKLEIISLSDGYKDYSEVNIKINPDRLGAVSPNPTAGEITIDYQVNSSDTAYITINGVYGGSNVSNNFIVAVEENKLNLDISNYPNGIYAIALVVNGQIQDSKTIVKQ